MNHGRSVTPIDGCKDPTVDGYGRQERQNAWRKQGNVPNSGSRGNSGNGVILVRLGTAGQPRESGHGRLGIPIDAAAWLDYHSPPNHGPAFALIEKEIVMRAWTHRSLAVSAACVSVGCWLACGCGKNVDKKDPGRGDSAENNGAAVSVQTKSAEPAAAALAGAAVLPFKDAVVFEPPDGEQRPPDKTIAGKNVGALFEEIAGQDGAPGLWDKIMLATHEGKRLRYTADLKTDLGTMTIELFADSAPNHVRNFIALARAGYYNGLPFHRSLNQQTPEQPLAYLEGGCPLGTGEFGFGSIGYWLKPEISSTLIHEDGTIGAVRGEALDSAACKFYITLAKAPGMDGGYTIFGKITRGLDIAHTINNRPNVADGDPSDRPKEPVVIRDVTIHVGGEEAAVVARNP
jgi:peptidyl-prolyl cis-trans isomerase B (cyclophilin B)